MANIIKQYSSVAALVGYLDTQKVHDWWGYQCSEDDDDYGYYTTSDYQTANTLAINGDRDNAKKLEKANARLLKLFAPIPKQTTCRHMMGYKPNVGAFVAGNPKSMIKRIPTKVKRPVVTIIYNTSALGDVKGQEIVDVNSRVLEAILAIERKGTKVNLYASTLARSEGQVVGPVVKIKDSGQPFNLTRTAYALVNPSFQRRHGWKFRETLKGIQKSFKNGYGASLQSRNAMDEALNGIVKYDVAFTFYDVRRMRTATEIGNWIEQQI